jgi:transcriptional regulator with XRE-family HTH domain
VKKRTENMKNFGKRIRELRIEKGITSQMSLANKIGTDRTYIGGIERGERNPTFEIIEKLAKALGTTLSDLMRFDLNSNYSINSKTFVLNDKEKRHYK